MVGTVGISIGAAVFPEDGQVYETLLAAADRVLVWTRGERAGLRAGARDGDHLAVLMFTSGTAGAPRAAMLSHRALLANIVRTLTATSTADSASDTVSFRFDVAYDHEPLEDSLAFDPRSLLPERRPPSIARSQLAAGLALASFAIAVPSVIGHGHLDGTRKHAVVMAGVTASGGIASFLMLRRGSSIPANILENARRREEQQGRDGEIGRIPEVIVTIA